MSRLLGSALSPKRLLLAIDTPRLHAPLLSPAGTHLAVYRRLGKTSPLAIPSPLSLLVQALPSSAAASSDSLLTEHFFTESSSSAGDTTSRTNAPLQPYHELAEAMAPPLQSAWTPCSRFYLTLMPDGHLTAFPFEPATGRPQPISSFGNADEDDDVSSEYLSVVNYAFQNVAQNVVSFSLPITAAAAACKAAPTVLVQDHRGVLRLCTLSAESSAPSKGTPIGQWPGRRENNTDDGPWLWDGSTDNPTVVGISAASETSLNPFQLLVGRRGIRKGGGGGHELVWDTLFSWNVFDRAPNAFTLLRFAPCSPEQPNPTAFYAIDARGTLYDKNCLVRVDFADRKNVKIDVVARHPSLDIYTALFDPSTGLPIAVAVKQHRVAWMPLDSPSLLQHTAAQETHRPSRSAKSSAKREQNTAVSSPETHALLRRLTDSVPGNCDVVNVQQNASGRWLLQTSADCASCSNFLFDHRSQEPSVRLHDTEPLLEHRSALDTPTTEPITIPFGNDNLDAYLTLPPKRQQQQNPSSTAAATHPLLVLPHGGPCERDNWEYNPIANFYATAGLAVLRVNYLGSAGYGRQFETRVYGRLGTDMTDSLVAATRWCTENASDRIDGSRVGIFGGSAGGYLAMSSLVRAPELFRCGAAWNGFFSLPTLASAGNDHVRHLVGDEKTAVDHSILSSAGRIRAPVLIMSGGKDPFVHFSHSVRLDRAIRSSGGKSKHIFFPSEGHEFSRAYRMLHAHGKVLSFLSKHLHLPKQTVSALDDLFFDRACFYLEHSVDWLSRFRQR